MTVMILGAGLGTRLRPLTNTIPKVMVPFGGKPLLEHTITLLKNQGFKDFVVNLHYLPEKITGYFGDGKKWGVNIEYSDETAQVLETGGALKKAEKLLSDEFILIYGDHLHFFDFRPVIDFHHKHGGIVTLVLKRSRNPQNGEVVEIDPESRRVVRYHVRPHQIYELGGNVYTNSGLYVLNKKILDHIPADAPIKLDGAIMPILLQKGTEICGYPTTENILDIGTPEKYKFAQDWYAEMVNMDKTRLS